MAVGGSIVDGVFEMKRAVTVDEINGMMGEAAQDGPCAVFLESRRGPW